MPTGLTLYLDGIAKTAPFVYDTLVGFKHTIEAATRSSGGTTYTFGSWSDGGAQQHTITVPSTDQTYTATYTVDLRRAARPSSRSTAPRRRARRAPSTTLTQAQAAGNLNAVVVGWNDATANITSVTDSAGNIYQLAAPDHARHRPQPGRLLRQEHRRRRGRQHRHRHLRQGRAVYADVRIAEYSGLDRTNPLDVTASAAGTTSAANSGTATTNFASALLLGAGTTSGGFTGRRHRLHPAASSPSPTATSWRTASSPAPAPTARPRRRSAAALGDADGGLQGGRAVTTAADGRSARRRPDGPLRLLRGVRAPARRSELRRPLADA